MEKISQMQLRIFFCGFLFLCFETGSHYVAQDGLKLAIQLEPLESWDYSVNHHAWQLIKNLEMGRLSGLPEWALNPTTSVLIRERQKEIRHTEEEEATRLQR
jgi:hypothetical protein